MNLGYNHITANMGLKNDDQDDCLMLDSECLSPCNLMEDVGLDDIKLVEISTKELNRHLKKKGVDKNRQREVKARRRTLKNRGYAASCRVKRDEEEELIKNDIRNLDREYGKEIYHQDRLQEDAEFYANLMLKYRYSPEKVKDVKKNGGF